MDKKTITIRTKDIDLAEAVMDNIAFYTGARPTLSWMDRAWTLMVMTNEGAANCIAKACDALGRTEEFDHSDLIYTIE